MEIMTKIAGFQLITINPICAESAEIKLGYFQLIKSLLNKNKLSRRKHTKAQLNFYKKTLCGDAETIPKRQFVRLNSKWCYYLPFDLVTILGYEHKIANSALLSTFAKQISLDFNLSNDDYQLLCLEFAAAMGYKPAWKKLVNEPRLSHMSSFMKIAQDNIQFLQKKSYKIMVTANMSAGKSTLINALVGKNICKMQNMACTSKIHHIIAKLSEDYAVSKHDYSISIDANINELHSNNEKNPKEIVYIGSHFHSSLSGLRLVLRDSPGVNSSENYDHTEVTQHSIQTYKNDLLIYVMNATQLCTCDEEDYLKFIANHSPKAKRKIFVINKIDQLLSEDEDVDAIIERQMKFLTANGFVDPIICPVSARAAYLARKSETESLSRIEQRELYNYMDKFEMNSLERYYTQNGVVLDAIDESDEVQKLLKNCGFLYFEQVIINHYFGGKRYDASLRKV